MAVSSAWLGRKKMATVSRLSNVKAHTLMPVQWIPTHHRPPSRFRIPSLFSSTTTSEQVISFARYVIEDVELLYALSRDRKLRIWNTATGACLRTVDVRSPGSKDVVARSNQATPPRTPSAQIPETESIPSVRIVRHPNPSSRIDHLVIVHLASPGDATPGTFVVYRVAKSTSDQPLGEMTLAGERECNYDSITMSLRGFEVTGPEGAESFAGWKLCVAWDAQGSLVVETISMDDIFQFTTYIESGSSLAVLFEWQRVLSDNRVADFDTAYFDNLLSVEPPDPENTQDYSDITQVFIQHLFYPGRFSDLSLSTALDTYISNLPRYLALGPLNQSYPSLAAKFQNIVGIDVQLKINPQTGAPEVQAYRGELKLQWLSIWAEVRDLDQRARWPIGTTKIRDQVMIVAREGFSTPVAEDTSTLINNAPRHNVRVDQIEDLPESAVSRSHPSIADPTFRENAIVISTTGQQLAEQLSSVSSFEEDGTALDVMIHRINDYLALAPTEPIEAIAGQSWEVYVEPYLSDEVVQGARDHLSDIADIPRALSQTLEVLSSFDSRFIGPFDATLRFSGLSNSLMAAAITTSVLARYELARSALLVSIFLVAVRGGIMDDEEGEDLIRLLSRVFATYHRYRVLLWLCEKPADEARARKLIRGVKRRMGDVDPDSFGTRENQSDLDVDDYETRYSLLHSLLARLAPQPVAPGPAGLFPSAVASFLSWACSITDGIWDTAPVEKDVSLALIMLEDSQPSHAGALADLFPPSSAMRYIKGRSLLDIEAVDESIVELERAAAGCSGKSTVH